MSAASFDDLSVPQQSIELSFVIPCLNEAETIAICIEKASSFLESDRLWVK